MSRTPKAALPVGLSGSQDLTLLPSRRQAQWGPPSSSVPALWQHPRASLHAVPLLPCTVGAPHSWLFRPWSGPSSSGVMGAASGTWTIRHVQARVGAGLLPAPGSPAVGPKTPCPGSAQAPDVLWVSQLAATPGGRPASAQHWTWTGGVHPAWRGGRPAAPRTSAPLSAGALRQGPRLSFAGTTGPPQGANGSVPGPGLQGPVNGPGSCSVRLGAEAPLYLRHRADHARLLAHLHTAPEP